MQSCPTTVACLLACCTAPHSTIYCVPDDMSNTPPGQVFCRDFRTGSASSAHDRPTIKLLQVLLYEHTAAQAWRSCLDRPLPRLQWNIERGYQLPGIIVELKLIDADVISLQEVDVGCKRSGSLDTGETIRLYDRVDSPVMPLSCPCWS